MVMENKYLLYNKKNYESNKNQINTEMKLSDNEKLD